MEEDLVGARTDWRDILQKLSYFTILLFKGWVNNKFDPDLNDDLEVSKFCRARTMSLD